MTRKRHPNRAYARFFRGGEIRPAARSPKVVAAAAASSARPSLNAAGGWRRAPAALVAALVMTSAALPVFSEAAHAQEVSERGAPPVPAETPVATMRGMVRAGSVPLSDSMLASAEGGILEGVRGFIASILGGDLLPEITFKDATVAGVGGDELAYAYGKEAADIKGDPDEIPHAGPGVELAEVPDSSTEDAAGPAGGRAVTSDGGSSEDAGFASPSLGGDPGSLDDIASADPSEFGTDDLDSPPGDGGELASFGLPGESPPSDLTPRKTTPTGEKTKEPAGEPTGETPAPPSAPPAALREATEDGADDSPPTLPKTPAAPQRPNPSTPPKSAASPPDLQNTAHPEPGGNGAVPLEEDGSPGYAGETVPGDELPAEGDPYAPEAVGTTPATASGESPHAEPDEDGGADGYDPGGYVPGGPEVASNDAEDGVGVVPDDPTLAPAEGLVEPDGEGAIPETPVGFGEDEGDTAQQLPDDGAASEDESPISESLDGGSAGQLEDPATNPDLDPGDGEAGYPADDPGAEDTSGPEETGDGGTDGGGGPDIAQQDATDPSQAQPGAEQDQEDGVPTDQPQDQPAPTAATTDTTADTTDGADGARQSPSEGSPDVPSGGERNAGSTPDPGQAEAAPDDAPADEPAAGAARELSSEQPGAGRSATQDRPTPRPEPAASRIAGRDKGDSATRAERRIRRQAARHAERRSERLAERRTERRADAQAQRRVTVAERKADRLSRGRARRQAAIAAAQGRSARKDPGRLEPRVSRGVPGGPHGGVRGALNAAPAAPARAGREAASNPPGGRQFAIERPQKTHEPARPAVGSVRKAVPAPRFEAPGRVAPTARAAPRPVVGTRPSAPQRPVPATPMGSPAGVPTGGPGAAKTPPVAQPQRAVPGSVRGAVAE